MPVEFLTDGQGAAYERFSGPPARAQLERFFFDECRSHSRRRRRS